MKLGPEGRVERGASVRLKVGEMYTAGQKSFSTLYFSSELPLIPN